MVQVVVVAENVCPHEDTGSQNVTLVEGNQSNYHAKLETS